jgi:peptidoglycan/LPS O-acetylase OafA/YrhL
MLMALASGALMILALVLVLWRGGPGRRWMFAGVLVLSAAGQLDWYGLNHGWPRTHHEAGAALLLANLASAACLITGWIKSRRGGGEPGREFIAQPYITWHPLR